MHLSFIQVCKSGAIDNLEKDSKGEGIICMDGGNKSRNEIHHERISLISDFLAKQNLNEDNSFFFKLPRLNRSNFCF